MADDKKTNLPAVIKNLPSTEVSRRDFLRGLTGTVAQGVLDTIPTAGGLIDLVTKKGYLDRPYRPFGNEGTIIRDLALLTKEIQGTIHSFNNDSNMKELHKNSGLHPTYVLNTNNPNNPYTSKRNKYNYIDRNHLLVNPKAYSNEVEDAIDEIHTAYMESGAYYEHDSQGQEEYTYVLEELQKHIEPLEIEYENKLKELKEVLIDKYGEKITEYLFDIEQPEHEPWGRTTIATILDDATDGLEVKDKYPDSGELEGWQMIGEAAQLEEYQKAAALGLDAELVAESEPETIQDKIDFAAKERIAEVEHDAKEKISVGDIAKTAGSEIIKRTLTKLATPKEATDTKQVKGPEQKQKQIQSSKTDSSSTNKLLKALSLFKRASPVGAALYTMKPTELARDDDYGFEVPVDR